MLSVAVASSLTMTACSRGGSGSAPTTSSTPATATAEGLYLGTVASTTPRVSLGAFQLLILENDEYWWMYGDNAPSGLVVENIVQGRGKSTATTFTSTTGTDFGGPSPSNMAITSDYVPNVSINGTVTAFYGSTAFSFAPPDRTTYDYNTAANLAAIVGAWSLSGLNDRAAAINIGASGVITGKSRRCTLTGTIAPRASGKNVFDTTVTFGPASCYYAGQTFTGIGLSYPVAGTTTRQLVIAGVNSDRTASMALYGTR